MKKNSFLKNQSGMHLDMDKMQAKRANHIDK